jgi:glycosyltransferase involved in cell wall biosynthesis
MPKGRKAAGAGLKVALYVPWIYQKGGVERTWLELIGRSRHDWTVFTHRYEPQSTFAEFSRLKVVELGRVPLQRNYGALSSASLSMLSQKIDLSDFDVFVVSTAGFAEFIALRNDQVPTIAFCHTPLRVVHDPVIRKKYLSENAARAIQFKVFERAYRVMERQAWRKFRFVVLASQEVASRILAAGLVGPEKLEFLKYGVDTKKFANPKRYGDFFFLPGRINWTKNVEMGILAYRRMVRDRPDLARFGLVVAGGVDEKSRGYYEYLKARYEKPSRGKIALVEDPSEDELLKLYSTCYCVLFPAINEDWGLIPIEAMSFSKPVIAANQGGPRESIVDGKTGFLAQPNERDFSEKMALVASDEKLARRLGAKGRKRAMQFDWAGAAQRMDWLVQEAAKAG